MFDSLQLYVLKPARLFCPWGSPGKNTGVGCHALLQGIFPTQRSNPGLSHCRDSLLSEPPGKPKKTRVGSQSLLQGNFLTQESNWGISHCRQILYQLSYQGSPKGRVVSPSGNRTLVSHLTGGDTHHYTKEEGGGLLASTAPNCH